MVIPYSERYFLNLPWLPGRKREGFLKVITPKRKVLYKRLRVGEPGLLWSDGKLYALLLSHYLERGKRELHFLPSRLLMELGRGYSSASYASLKTSLAALESSEVEVALFVEGKERVNRFRLVEEVKFLHGELTVILSGQGIEKFLAGKEEREFPVPLEFLLDRKVRGLAFNLLSVGYYFFYRKVEVVNLGEPLEFFKKWLNLIVENDEELRKRKLKEFKRKFKRAVDGVNRLRGVPFSLRISRDFKWLVVKRR